MKRTLLVFLVVLVSAAFVWGGGGGQGQSQGAAKPVMDNGRELIGNTYSTGLPIIKNPETFKIAVLKQNNDMTKGFMEKVAFQKAEKETGLKFEFIEVPQGAAQNERIPILLASDPPDAFDNLLNSNHIVQNASVFLNLAENDLLKKFAPKVVKDIDSIPDGWAMITFPNGAIYSLPTQMQVNHDNDAQGIAAIRKDWLDKLGLQMPKTLDEYLNVLKAFRDRDPNGNGQKDEIPVGFNETAWNNFMFTHAGPWGIAPDRSTKEFYWFRINNKKVEPVLTEKRFRDFLTFQNMLVKEKLLDPEGFTHNSAQFNSKRDGNIYGVTNAWDVSSFIGANWIVLQPFSAPGYQFLQCGVKDSYQGSNTGFAITRASKNPTAVLRWWDYLSSTTEMKYLVRYGAEGQLWERDRSGTVWAIYPPETDPNFNREAKKYSWGFYNGCPIILKDEFEKFDGVKYPLSVSRENMVKQVENHFPKEVVPRRFVSLEASRRRIMLETELVAYVESFMAKAITTGEGLDDTGWNAHLKQLDTLQFKDWLQWYQDLIDGKHK